MSQAGRCEVAEGTLGDSGFRMEALIGKGNKGVVPSEGAHFTLLLPQDKHPCCTKSTMELMRTMAVAKWCAPISHSYGVVLKCRA